MTVNTNGEKARNFLARDKIVSIQVRDYNNVPIANFTQVVAEKTKVMVRPDIVLADGSPGFLEFEISVEDV